MPYISERRLLLSVLQQQCVLAFIDDDEELFEELSDLFLLINTSRFINTRTRQPRSSDFLLNCLHLQHAIDAVERAPPDLSEPKHLSANLCSLASCSCPLASRSQWQWFSGNLKLLTFRRGCRDGLLVFGPSGRSPSAGR